jgi:hypothetical protein
LTIPVTALLSGPVPLKSGLNRGRRSLTFEYGAAQLASAHAVIKTTPSRENFGLQSELILDVVPKKHRFAKKSDAMQNLLLATTKTLVR